MSHFQNVKIASHDQFTVTVIDIRISNVDFEITLVTNVSECEKSPFKESSSKYTVLLK